MRYLLLVLGMMAVLAPAFAANLPLDVDADRLEVDQGGGHAVFTGNVKAVRGDWTMTAARADIDYSTDSKGKKSGGDIKEVVATGNVVITRHNSLSPNDVATGDKAVYTPATNKLVMTGGVVKLTRGGHTLTGTRLDYDTANGQAVMQGGASGGSGRVHAHFQNEGNESK
jgi:lipopolysaccharide export system protein LptA